MKPIRSISVIGLSKNAGKTTVLNALIHDYPKSGFPLGLLSMGVDGEQRDAWSGREKPPIRVRKNMLVATSAFWLNRQPGNWEVLQDCGISSVLGKVYIARAKREGAVQLAGIPTRNGAKQAMRLLSEAGAEKILLDGAYDRRSPSCPQLTDASIVVIGASLSPSLTEVIKKAKEWFRLFRLKESTAPLERQAGHIAIKRRRVVGVLEGRLEILPLSGFLELKVREKEWIQNNWDALAMAGALTDQMLETLLQHRQAVRLIIPSAAHLFVHLPMFYRFHRQGGEIRVLEPIRLIKAAINPDSPEGYSFPPQEMKEKIGQVCFPLPVVDAVRDPREQGVWDGVL
ncbi:lysine 5,6-aminomutase reactivase subunit KamB [Thermoactinomyces mirandus]|uniref:Uncharacterized protein n=1 Tax=Thermoactinomyces mirandus TaxID=2756294 RepID=A0A7W1XTG0_9BACL|nr:hypothetical protein [Thermoactinomyces mirandus]MBA4602910.1 hypothetical protein [Thermoactinomyces mirandus]